MEGICVTNRLGLNLEGICISKSIGLASLQVLAYNYFVYGPKNSKPRVKSALRKQQ